MQDPYWLSQFYERMDRFGLSPDASTEPISVKVRVDGGCFHREHSPEAYRLIDEHVQGQRFDEKIRIEEHESGPEILAYVVAGLAFTKSLIDLVVTIIKARSEGIKKGDGPRGDLELIVRRFNRNGEYTEEKILRISSVDQIDARELIQALENRPKPIVTSKLAKRTKKRTG